MTTSSSTPRKHLLKDMTWVEFRERMAEDPIVLLPFGSQEEQGPVAPMGDHMLTEILADRIAEAADVIAAPTIPFGYADYFRTMPGGIQFRPETFCHVLEDMCESFLDHGVNRLLIFNGHSGNYPLIDQTLRKLKRERGILIPCVNIWRVLTAADWAGIHDTLGIRAMGHGSDPLTSVYMHYFPDLLRMDLAQPKQPRRPLLGLPTAGFNAVTFHDVDINLAVDVTDCCDNGIVGGEPAASSAEAGARISKHIVDFTVEFLEHFRTVDPRVDRGTESPG